MPRSDPGRSRGVLLAVAAVAALYGMGIQAQSDDGRHADTLATAGHPATPREQDVRLVGGSDDAEGRVEIYHDGVWGTVCDDYWSEHDADLVCRQLGHEGAETVLARARFGQGRGPIWMDDLRCTAAQAASAGAQSATRLGDCAFPGWGVHNCSHGEDAGVVCAARGAGLASLALSYVDLAFSPATTAYRVRVANAVASVTVTAVPVGDASATVSPADGDDVAEGHQVVLDEGPNTVVVTVVAGASTTAYTVVVTREAPLGATMPERLTEANVTSFLADQGIFSVAQFIEALPPLHKRHFVAVLRSQSPVADFVSVDYPRIVSWGADAEFLLTWTTDPASPGHQSVEFLTAAPDAGRWTAGVIDFSGTDSAVRRPATCAGCHSDIDRPIWGVSHAWHGTESSGANGQPEGEAEQEAAFARKMTATSDPRLAQLEFTYAANGKRRLSVPRRITVDPNWEFTHRLPLRQAEVLFSRLGSRPHYAGLATSVICAASPMVVLREEISRSRHHLALLSGSGDFVQMPTDGTVPAPVQASEYSYEGVLNHVLFLMLHRAAKTIPEVGRLYETTTNDEFLSKTGNTESVIKSLLEYPTGSATTMQELDTAYEDFHTLRGQASLARRTVRGTWAFDTATPRYGQGVLAAHAHHFAPRVCRAIAPLSDDAHLVGLTLSGVDIGTFDPETTAYAARVGAGVTATTVTATPRDGAATVAIALGDDVAQGTERAVSLETGDNDLRITVTAEDGNARVYDVSVHRAGTVPLTATFEDLPEAHDGAAALLFRTRFSEPIRNTHTSMRDSAFTVAGGSVTRARRVDGSIMWEIAITPAGNADLAIALEANRPCGAGVCTRDGRRLSERVAAAVKGPMAAPLPELSIAVAAGSVTEGEPAVFVVTPDRAIESALTASVDVARSGGVLAGTTVVPVAIGAGDAGATLAVATDDDRVVEDDGAVTVTLIAGTGYAVGVDAVARVTVVDEDVASFAVTAAPQEIEEGGSSTLSVSISNDVSFATDQMIALTASGSTAQGDYRVSASPLTLIAGATSATATISAVDDADAEDAETVVLTAHHDGTAVGSATVTIAANDRSALTAWFENVPSSHDGAEAFSLTLRFSEELAKKAGWKLRSGAVRVSNGSLQSLGWVNGSRATWTVAVRPSGTADVAVSVAGGLSCAEGPCTPHGGRLSAGASATVPGPARAAPDAVGQPTLTAGETTIDASWRAPANNGSSIEGYDVEYRTTGSGWTDAGHVGTGTSARIAGLAGDTAYDVRVRAYNAAGTGAWSAPASATTPPSDGPSETDLRLVGGANAREGRVEIYHAGEWGTVCDDSWTPEDAEVACRQLGYAGTASAHTRATFGAGTGQIWMDDVRCAGDEERLADCEFRGWGSHNCRHSEDAGASCGAAAGALPADATLSGATLTVRFGHALDGGSTPSPQDFVVRSVAVDDTAPVTATSVAVSGTTVLIRLSRRMLPDERVTASYLEAAMHPLQDVSGNPVAAFADQPVRYVTRAHLPSRVGSQPRAAGLRTAVTPGTVKVERLDLSARQLTDVSALSGLVDLEVLDLHGNAVADTWGLSGLTGLHVLDLSGNRIADVSALSRLSGLRVLDLSGNRIADVSALSRLSGLRVLDLSGNRIEDVSALWGLTGLRRLNLSGNRLVDIGPLANLTGLEVLLLDGNAVTEVLPLVGLANLVHLGLSGNRLAAMDLLAELGSLRRVDLAANRLTDVSALGDLSALAWLRLPGNPIADVSALGRLAELRWLWLDDRPMAGRNGLGPHTVVVVSSDIRN